MLTAHESSAIAATLDPEATLLSVDRLTGGVSADVFRFDLAGGDGKQRSYVVRVHGETHSGHPADTEYALLSWLYDAGVPVPKPLVVDISRATLSESWLAMVFIPGSSGIPQERQVESIDTIAEALAGIHALTLDGLPELPRRLDPLPEVFTFLPDNRDWAGLRNALRAFARTAYEGAPVLLHGDYWPANLLWSNSELVAILDWEDAAIGDPMCDVAQARVELRYWFGADSMETFTHAYERHAPVDRRRLLLWQVYVAAAARTYVSGWGLPAEQEAHIKREALASVEEAWGELSAF